MPLLYCGADRPYVHIKQVYSECICLGISRLREFQFMQLFKEISVKHFYSTPFLTLHFSQSVLTVECHVSDFSVAEKKQRNKQGLILTDRIKT